MPLAFFGSLAFPASAFHRSGVVSRLQALGFNSVLVDVHLSAAAAAGPDSLDALVAELRAALLAAFGAAPVAVAAHHAPVLMQKYLESWPLAGLVLLDPLPPRIGPTLQRWGFADHAGAGAGLCQCPHLWRRGLHPPG